MNATNPTQPRMACGFAAMIMSAITIGLLVVLPSKMEPESQAFAMLTAASRDANPCADDNASPVHGVAGMTRPAIRSAVEPKCKEQG